MPGMDDPDATIGTYGATYRRGIELRAPKRPVRSKGKFVQVQRMGNPLFNELIIGTGFKDLWSRSEPEDDAQFADFALDPLIARVTQAAFGGASTSRRRRATTSCRSSPTRRRSPPWAPSQARSPICCG